MSKDRFYSLIERRWSTDQPRKNDIRCKMDTQQICKWDEHQWRPICLDPLCQNQGRPLYCRQHMPDRSPKESLSASRSRSACAFFDAFTAESGVPVQHVHYHEDGTTTGQEFTIPGTCYKVDGRIPHSPVVIEFLGDYWHGNPQVFADHAYHPVIRKTFGQIRQETFQRLRFIQTRGYRVYFVWEQDWRAKADHHSTVALTQGLSEGSQGLSITPSPTRVALGKIGLLADGASTTPSQNSGRGGQEQYQKSQPQRQ